MKNVTEKTIALIAAFILMCAMTGCGQANVDQGEVDTTPKQDDPSLPGAGGASGGDVLDNEGKGKGKKGKKPGDGPTASPDGGSVPNP